MTYTTYWPRFNGRDTITYDCTDGEQDRTLQLSIEDGLKILWLSINEVSQPSKVDVYATLRPVLDDIMHE